VVSGIDVRRQAGRPGRSGGVGFDLVASKLLAPLARPGTVRRSSLVERLVRGDACPIVSVVAPAGYGKTTLLSQWAQANGQAFAWVSADDGDNDPKVLLGYVAEALDAVELFLSRHTIKSQANSIYRKLGASSRSQAVTRARELNLLEG
jgi:ATP/maltotriose-dependent transcriptional regulator MalT